AVKRHFKTLKAKEPPQENPQTSIQEPAVDTDLLESQPVCDYAQATQSSAVVSAESSSDVFKNLPADAPEPQNNRTTDASEQRNSLT
ncbi:hypothetical protein M9458_049852, partial [Cirrhinus mrigala]